MARSHAIVAALYLAGAGAASAQVGRYYDYSGTISWKNRLDFTGATLTGYTADSVVVTVVKDKATCSGTWIHNTRAPSSATPLLEKGTISGPGLIEIVVQPDHVTPGSGTYQIVVACPTPATATDPSTPAKFDGRQVVIGGHELPSIRHLAELKGSNTIPHPETDPVNGATGTFSVTWHLTTVRR